MRRWNWKKAGAACALVLLMLLVLLGAAERRPVLSGEAIWDSAAQSVFYVRSLDGNGDLKTSGSGFTVTPEGLAVTASHVIRGASQVNVVLPEGRELAKVEVLSRDDVTDVALLRLPEREGGYPYLSVEAQAPKTGEAVYAIGYPLKTVKIISDGVVCSQVSPINGYDRLLVSADFASGMSGGPVLCEHGGVAGIVSATVRTMNGVSISPTTKQLNEAIERQTQAEEAAKAAERSVEAP